MKIVPISKVFDFRTLLITHKQYPKIRTVCLFGDFPEVGNTGDGTNLQDQEGQNTPWLAGLYWPYRNTKLDTPFKVRRSGGFEGMALTTDKGTLLPLLKNTSYRYRKEQSVESMNLISKTNHIPVKDGSIP